MITLAHIVGVNKWYFAISNKKVNITNAKRWCIQQP